MSARRHPITSDACGTRWYLDKQPVADLFLIEERKVEPTGKRRTGQFGAVERDRPPYSEPHPWTVR